MKRNKVLALILSVSMVTGCLVGCGSSDTASETTTETTTEAVESSDNAEEVSTEESSATISFPLEEGIEMTMFTTAVTTGYSLDEIRPWEIMEEKTNISWDLEEVDTASLAEQRGLLLSTNQYPDVFYKAGFTQIQVDEQAANGTFIPLEDLIAEYAPNLQAILDENPVIKETITSVDGHIYSLPQIVAPDPSITNTWINTVWLENLDLEYPESADDFYEVLKAFKEQDANGNGDTDDEIPFSTYSGISFINFMPYFGVTVDPTTRTTYIDDTVTYVPTMDEYKEMLKYLAQLYDEKLLDNNSFSQTLDQMKAIGLSGDSYGSALMLTMLFIVEDGAGPNYDVLNIWEGGTVYEGTGVTVGTLTITDTCEYPEAVIAWADYFYTEEGGALAWTGIEGETYELDENGVYTDIKDPDDVSPSTLQGGSSLPSLRNEEVRNQAMSDGAYYFQAERDRCYEEFGTPMYTVFKFTEEETSAITNYKTAIDTYVDEYLAQVVTGAKDIDATWDTYVSDLEKMGLNEMLAYYQSACE